MTLYNNVICNSSNSKLMLENSHLIKSTKLTALIPFAIIMKYVHFDLLFLFSFMNWTTGNSGYLALDYAGNIRSTPSTDLIRAESKISINTSAKVRIEHMDGNIRLLQALGISCLWGQR